MVARRVKRGDKEGSLLTRMINRPATNSPKIALLWGLAWLIIASIAAWYFRLEPTSIFGYTVSEYVPLATIFIMHVVIWLTATIIPFAFAVIRNRKVSVVEFFGRMLFAHWPVTLLIVPAIIGSVDHRIAYSIYMADSSLCWNLAPTYAMLMTIICSVVLVWWLYWGYLAFRRAQNSGGGIITIISYVVSIGLSYPLTVVVADMIR